jgi:molybdopterin molybdotransferase
MTLDELIASTPGYDPDALPLEAAQRMVREFVPAPNDELRVPLRAALGRVTAADVHSPLDVPGGDSSAMDGWAVRGVDLEAEAPVTLTQVGRSFAGHPFDGSLKAGECVRIMTGALLPPGTDTVVLQEVVSVAGNRITVPPGQRAGQNRRRAGEDIARGQLAIAAGRVVRPATLGLAASLGLEWLSVRPRLRVAFFSSGDELTPLGEPLARGEVHDSNRHMLWALLERLGCETIDLGIVRDEPRALVEALREGARRADAIVTTGGAAEGEADFTRQVAADLGDVRFWKLAVRPGRPFAFGRVADAGREAAFFGLPGNPVAALIGFYLLVQPALRRMMGCAELEPPRMPLRALEPMKKRLGREEYQRGMLARGPDGVLGVRALRAQGSATLASAVEAQCLIRLPRELPEIRAGDTVEVIVLDGLA